jgi:hypothetical protein
VSDTVVYRGYGNDHPAAGRLVTATRDGVESPLRHIVRHSPTGMTWGYEGSGPADLALSLLVDALGDRAKCPLCGGTGMVVFDALSGEDVPFDPDRHPPEGNDRYSEPRQCLPDCDRLRLLPYQQFKRDVVASLPESWTLTRGDIIDWYDQRHRSEQHYMKPATSRPVDRDHVIALLEASAFDTGRTCPTCEGAGTVPGGRRVVHVMAGSLGADWDVDEAVKTIQEARTVEYTDRSFMGHNLRVVTGDGRVRLFTVPKQEEHPS